MALGVLWGEAPRGRGGKGVPTGWHSPQCHPQGSTVPGVTYGVAQALVSLGVLGPYEVAQGSPHCIRVPWLWVTRRWHRS